MRLGVSGSRHWTDVALIRATLDSFRPVPSVIIHGGARGVDSIADQWARNNGIARATVRPGDPAVKADYIRRNVMIVDMAEQLIAFRATGESSGTDRTIEFARKAGKLGVVVDLRETE